MNNSPCQDILVKVPVKEPKLPKAMLTVMVDTVLVVSVILRQNVGVVNVAALRFEGKQDE